MKKIIASSLFTALFLMSTILLASDTVTEKFKVWGNCGMCKKTIEKSLRIEGVSKASWDVKSKEITVTYNPKKTDLKTIQNAICAAGYDNDGCKGSDAAYNKLHSCCKYDRKE
ncbi:MAG: cation transporter [Bacteroidia bacterium]|nr:cation transporter [Bacteroidia bacterium]MCZ2248399.1 heavy-metal-associated domain-containing protein [Bacteroidia bacterium]